MRWEDDQAMWPNDKGSRKGDKKGIGGHLGYGKLEPFYLKKGRFDNAD
jgi:hypothetical protein